MNNIDDVVKLLRILNANIQYGSSILPSKKNDILGAITILSQYANTLNTSESVTEAGASVVLPSNAEKINNEEIIRTKTELCHSIKEDISPWMKDELCQDVKDNLSQWIQDELCKEAKDTLNSWMKEKLCQDIQNELSQWIKDEICKVIREELLHELMAVDLKVNISSHINDKNTDTESSVDSVSCFSNECDLPEQDLNSDTTKCIPKPISNNEQEPVSYDVPEDNKCSIESIENAEQNFNFTDDTETMYVPPAIDDINQKSGNPLTENISENGLTVFDAEMDDFVNLYNTTPYRNDNLKLRILEDIKEGRMYGKRTYQSPSIDDMLLEETDSKFTYFGKKIKGDNNYYFIVPIKSAKLSDNFLFQSACEDFFELENYISGSDQANSFTLVKAAIFEKDTNDKYRFIKKGKIKF